MADGHSILAAVRDPERFKRRFPGAEAIHADLNHLTDPSHWIPLLSGADAVLNCAGALQSGRGQDLRAIHERAPIALFDASTRVGIRRIIQVSAISANANAGTEYALTKLSAEHHLQRLPVDWVILRPSLVYGAGSYGGTSLMRALAALPFAMPTPGSGDQVFQPIHVDDLADAISRLFHDRRINRATIEPVGPERLTLREILIKLRRWLGLRPAGTVRMPMLFVRVAAGIGDWIGAGPLRTTSLKQMAYGNVGDVAAFIEATGIEPRSMDAALSAQPATGQDLWHARLFFLRPLLRLALGLFFIWTGAAALLFAQRADSESLLLSIALPPSLVAAVLWGSAFVDIALGVWLLATRHPARVAGLMLALTSVYLIVLTIGIPALWLDPLGALAKVPIIMIATMFLMATAEER